MRFSAGADVRRWLKVFQFSKTRVRSRRECAAFIAAEVLELRCLLSTTAAAVPWVDATALTVSFVPDGTQVGGQSSTLFASLARLGSTSTWQQTILDAFQTWAVSANINIGLVSDGGQPFGTPGLTQGDPRFGDIRIGAAPLSSNVLAIAIPARGSASGTWSGDVIFNSNSRFTSLNDLYAVALHEAGHALGLPDSADPASPLYSGFTPGASLTVPTPADILTLQQLYGARVPQVNNQTFSTARNISSPYGGSTPLITYGQVGVIGETDYFSVTPPTGYSGSITFELRTAGISGLSGTVSVYDAQGNLLSHSSATAPGQDLVVTVDASQVGSPVIVKVESPAAGIHGVGSFTLVTKFDAQNTVAEATIDAVARGHFTRASASQIRQILLSGSIPPAKGVQQPTPASSSDSPVELATTAGFSEGTQFNATGALTSTNPSTTYKVEAASAPAGQTSAMIVTVQTDASAGAVPIVSVLDDEGNLVAGQLLASGPGIYTFQVAGDASGKEYLISVGSSGQLAQGATAKYSLDVKFSATPVGPVPYGTGTLTPGQPQQLMQLNVTQSGLFQFGLSTGISYTSSYVTVQLAILDSSGNPVYSVVGTPGTILGAAPVLLNPGSYLVSVSASSASSGLAANLDFSIVGNLLSDPIGPIPANPTGSPPIPRGPIPPPFNWTNWPPGPPPIALRPPVPPVPWAPLPPNLPPSVPKPYSPKTPPH